MRKSTWTIVRAEDYDEVCAAPSNYPYPSNNAVLSLLSQYEAIGPYEALTMHMAVIDVESAIAMEDREQFVLWGEDFLEHRLSVSRAMVYKVEYFAPIRSDVKMNQLAMETLRGQAEEVSGLREELRALRARIEQADLCDECLQHRNWCDRCGELACEEVGCSGACQCFNEPPLSLAQVPQ